ncbi:hypothetical protein ACHAWT_005452, partial [Skeletonema menzelii]
MKLYLIAAAGAALLCATTTSVEARVGQAVEVQNEEGFLEQASNYLLEADSSEILVEKKSSEGGEAPAKPPKPEKAPKPDRAPKPEKAP